MAGKKTFLIFSKCAAEVLLKSADASIAKLAQKGAVAPLVVTGDVEKEAGSGAADGQMLWDAAKAAGLVVEPITEEGTDFAVAHADDEAATAAELEKAFSLGMRKLVIAVVCPDKAIFHGLGVARGKVLDKPVPAASVAPTLALLGDLPFPANVEAPIAYGVLKDLDFKMREVRKLVETNEAMMEAMERGNRKPWDKHDCA